MANLVKIAALAAVLGCLFAAAPALAQENNCMSLTMLIQGKLNPPTPWSGPIKGLLIDKDNKVWPLEGKLGGPAEGFGDKVAPVYTGQVAHETFHFSFDFGTAGKFAGLLDSEIAHYSPSVMPHVDFSQGPPPFALGTTKSTFKVAPQTAVGWASSGWFEKAIGNLSATGTFLVNSVAVPPAPAPPSPGVIGYWNVEVTGKLCNLDVK